MLSVRSNRTSSAKNSTAVKLFILQPFFIIGEIDMKFLASFFFMFLLCFISYSAEITAKIVKIIDGDTIKVEEVSGDFKGNFVVRLYGIDAPEKDQEFGLESKEELLKILNKVAVIKFASTDRYGRLIGEVFVGENSVNLSMLKNGFAWYFSDYAKND